MNIGPKNYRKFAVLLEKNLIFNFSTAFQFQHRYLYIHGVLWNFLLWQRMYKRCWNWKKIPLYLIKFKQLLKYLSTHLTTAGSKKFLNVMLISCHAALLFCSYFLTWHISHKELAVVGFYFETKPWCIALYIQGMAEWLRRWISEWPKFDSWWTHLCHVVKLVEYQGQQYCYLEWPGSIPPGATWNFLW